jgi:hypothetical protein
LTQEAEVCTADYKPRDVTGIEHAKPEKTRNISDDAWLWPIAYEVKFGLSRVVPIFSNIVTNEFKARTEEMAFLQV